MADSYGGRLLDHVHLRVSDLDASRRSYTAVLGVVGIPVRGGEGSFSAIARALSVEPHVILADEPTGNLDTKTGADIIETLAGLAARRGTTIIVATHDADLAERAPRRLAMRDGRLRSLAAV